MKKIVLRCPKCGLVCDDFFCNGCKSSFTKEEFLSFIKKRKLPVGYEKGYVGNVYFKKEDILPNINKKIISLNKDLHKNFISYINELSKEKFLSYLAVLNFPHVYGNTGFVIKNGYLLLDLILNYYQNYAISLLFSLQKLPKNKNLNNKVFLAVTPSYTNYFHFLFDFLPKLYFLSFLESIDKVIINNDDTKFINEIYNYLSLNKKKYILKVKKDKYLKLKGKLIPHSKNFSVNIEECYVPNLRENSEFLPPWSVFLFKIF